MKALAIGGPADGQWLDSSVDNHFPVVMERGYARKLLSPALSDRIHGSCDVPYHRYRPEHIKTSEDNYITVFVPLDWTTEKLMKRLINGYRVVLVEEH